MNDDIATRAKEIWLSQADHRIEYDSFIERLERLAQGNPATIRNLARGAGLIRPTSYTAEERATRPFVAYDGEGHDNKYTLLANSLGESIQNPDGLSTDECLEFLNRKYSHPIIRVFYGFNYDINHILRDLNPRAIDRLMTGKVTKYDKYRLSFFPAKMFNVNNVVYYDVITFFQRAFIRTVELMLGPDAVSERLVAGKAARGNFETWKPEDIEAYNAEELQLLVAIMDKFRDTLHDANINLGQWHGPGAIANLWMREHKIVTPKVPEAVENALDLAYYGGRFEQIHLGKIKPVYEYDIRSAYPAAMSTMPEFTKWSHSDKYIPDAPYAIWHINLDLRPWYIRQYLKADDIARMHAGNDPTHCDIFMPLPMRNKQGIIAFPMIVRGWYWAHELQLVMDFFPEEVDPYLTILEGYVAETSGNTPFEWVADMYRYRQELKAAGNLSEYGVKVGLNSLYGKTAQRIGAAKYHSLAWAGYITSSVRAKIARAGYSAGGYKKPETNASHIIGFATDAIFSDVPLKLPLSTNLGDWEEQRFTDGLFIQSGVYRLRDGMNNKNEDRYRGNPMRDGLDDIVQQLTKKPVVDPVVHRQIFVSHRMANLMPKALGPYRLRFVRTKQKVYIAESFKRHYLFPTFDLRPEPGVSVPVRHLGRLLNHTIYSRPKTTMNEQKYGSDENYRNLLITDEPDLTESYPPARKQSLLDDDLDESYDAENPFDDLLSLLTLPEKEALIAKGVI